MEHSTVISQNAGKRIYPYFGVTDDGPTVLFTSEATGFTLSQTDEYLKLGHFGAKWTEDSFTPLRAGDEINILVEGV